MQNINAGTYNIVFNNKCYAYLQQLLMPGTYSKIFILTDTNSSAFCLPLFLGNLATNLPFEIIETEPGEELKTLQTCNDIWITMSELGADRKSLMINLGGGVITDTGGFAASVYKRGIDFINVPTTLLAMVDAAIGGKTGVNLESIKNQIGTINNPVAILIDTTFLNTLPQKQMLSGLAEMLKHGLIYDKEYWNKFNNLSALTTGDLDEMIYKSVEIKNTIVLQDPFEKSIRKILNYGHTIGHALESFSLKSTNMATLLHGEAIAAGMVMEAYLSKEKKFISHEEFLEIKKVILSLFETIKFSPDDLDEIIALLDHDKKNEFNKIKFVLLNGIGNAKINQEVEKPLILKAFEDYNE